MQLVRVMINNKVANEEVDTHVVGDEDVDDLVRCLSDEEIEVAARSTYAYAHGTSTKHRLEYAKDMALRFLHSKKRDKVRALEGMKNTITFRREKDIDGLQKAMEDPLSDYHARLRDELSSRHTYVQGYDKDGRSTYVFVPRRVKSHDPTWTLNGHIWTLEKAIACSKAKDHTVNAVVDFSGFSAMHNVPPTSVGKELMATLRKHYVGHVNQIFLIDAPYAFLFLWAIFKPFAGRMTREKIHFVSSHEQKQIEVGQWYNTDQATPWMLPGGKKNRDLDLDEYLRNQPFDRAFDEE